MIKNEQIDHSLTIYRNEIEEKILLLETLSFFSVYYPTILNYTSSSEPSLTSLRSRF